VTSFLQFLNLFVNEISNAIKEEERIAEQRENCGIPLGLFVWT
jgi:hypothetical protein